MQAWFNRLTLRYKLMVPMMVLALLLLIGFALSWRATQTLAHNGQTLAEHYLPTVSQVLTASAHLYRAQAAERSLLFVAVSSDEFTLLSDTLHTSVTQARQAIEQVQTPLLSPAAQALTEEFLHLHSQWQPLVATVQRERASDTRIGRTNAREISFGSGLETFEQMRAVLHQLQQLVSQDSTHNAQMTLTQASTSQTNQIIVFLVQLVVCTLTLVLFPGLILRPIRLLEATINTLSATGQLSARVPVTSDDEIGRLSQQINRLLDDIQQTITVTSTALAQVARGDFDIALEAQVKGDLQQLQTNVRACTQSIQHAMLAINQITEDLARGDFSTHPAPQLQGEFAQTLDNARQTKQLLSSVISRASQVVSVMATGHFDAKIELPCPGELDRLKQGINTTAASMAKTMDHLLSMMDALAQGQFHHQSDQQLPGRFGDTINALTDAMQRLDETLTDIAMAMQGLAEGQLQQRVTVHATGQLADLKRHVNTSLDRVQRIAGSIRTVLSSLAQGDLSQRIDIECAGTFLQIKQDTNQAFATISSTLSDIRGIAHQVAQSTQALTQGASDLSLRTQTQSTTIEQTSQSMNRISQSAHITSALTDEAKSLANESVCAAENGVEAFNRITTSVLSINESSQHIGNIIGVIDELAFQTNLLALNAAVEAARAGEQGRGFAVVATEVRQLAQRSAQSAKQIKDLVAKSIEQVEQGTQLVNQSSQVLDNILHSIGNVQQKMLHITEAMNDQDASIEQINQSVSHIKQDNQANNSLVQQANAATSTIAQESQHLNAALSRFTLH